MLIAAGDCKLAGLLMSLQMDISNGPYLGVHREAISYGRQEFLLVLHCTTFGEKYCRSSEMVLFLSGP